MKFVSALVTKASGSIGGITASHNRYGKYFRERVVPTDPASFLQQLLRIQMAAMVNAWQNVLSDGQRNDWETYAENVPVTDSLGDQINLTGQQHYIRSNVGRRYYGEERVDDAPTIFNMGDFTAVTLSASAATQLASITFENTDDWANEDEAYMQVALSTSQNPTINFFKGPYKRKGHVEGDAVTPPTSPQTFTVSSTVTEGQRIFGHVRVSRADGRLSYAQKPLGLVLA